MKDLGSEGLLRASCFGESREPGTLGVFPLGRHDTPAAEQVVQDAELLGWLFLQLLPLVSNKHMISLQDAELALTSSRQAHASVSVQFTSAKVHAHSQLSIACSPCADARLHRQSLWVFFGLKVVFGFFLGKKLKKVVAS